MLKFKGTLKKIGNSWMVIVPSDYIKNGMVNTDDEYWFEIMQDIKTKDGEKNEKNKVVKDNQ
jgi:antitoxin component of MazEF toxin-antitoxin module